MSNSFVSWKLWSWSCPSYFENSLRMDGVTWSAKLIYCYEKIFLKEIEKRLNDKMTNVIHTCWLNYISLYWQTPWHQHYPHACTRSLGSRKKWKALGCRSMDFRQCACISIGLENNACVSASVLECRPTSVMKSSNSVVWAQTRPQTAKIREKWRKKQENEENQREKQKQGDEKGRWYAERRAQKVYLRKVPRFFPFFLSFFLPCHQLLLMQFLRAAVFTVRWCNL